MKILSIGNSFSQDAQRYLYDLAKKEGVDLKVVNLYIGGCSLATHHQNMKEDAPAYLFELNGKSTGLFVSISQALASDEWDVITLQQASRFSWDYTTYQPYITELADYIRSRCPSAKIYIHETWAYPEGSQSLRDTNVYTKAEQMYLDLKDAYRKAFKDINAFDIIPSGSALFRVTQTGINKVHRDNLHASLGVGRYLLALTWFKTLTGKEIKNNKFNALDEPVSRKERKIIIKAVEWAIENK